MNRFLTPVLTVVLTVTVAASAACSESDGPASARSLAARAVQLLSRGEIRSVAEMMHYPPTYTPEEREKDMSSTGDGLDLMAREFGKISGLKGHTGLARFYEIGGSGGDVPYLSSLSPHYSTQFLYEAKFSKLGDGYIRVTVIQLTAESHFEILGLYLGLPAANPHSKPAIIGITRRQLIHMQVPVTPDVERQIERSLRPVRYPTE
jgi:hypothetical protein